MLGLETVHLDSLFLNSLLDQNFQNLLPLVPLELDNFTHLLIVYDRTIARKLLLERFQEFLGIILGWNSLKGGDGLASVSLLDTDVDSVGLFRFLYFDLNVFFGTFVGESVVGFVQESAHYSNQISSVQLLSMCSRTERPTKSLSE